MALVSVARVEVEVVLVSVARVEVVVLVSLCRTFLTTPLTADVLVRFLYELIVLWQIRFINTGFSALCYLELIPTFGRA